MVRGAFRQARELADGQKRADVKHNWALPPPLRQLRQLAERVEFPERLQIFRLSGYHLAEGGQISEKNAGSLVASLIIRRRTLRSGDFEPRRDWVSFLECWRFGRLRIAIGTENPLRLEGFEPSAASLHGPNRLRQSRRVRAAKSDAVDSILQELIDAWPDLQEEVRLAVLVMVRAAMSK